jgi:hypothetical protein
MNVQRFVACAAGIFLLAVGDPLLAQQTDQPAAPPRPVRRAFATEGVIEVGGTGSFTSTVQIIDGKRSGNALTVFTFLPYVGFFATDWLQLGANPLGVTLMSSGGSTFTSLRLLGSVAFMLRAQRMAYPFLEGLVGYTADISSPSIGNKVTRSGITWGGRAGVKVPVTERGLLTLGVQYLLITKNLSGASERTGLNELAVSAGFSVWF